MANSKPFDETLYRLVEQDDTTAGAAELKSRIDTEPEFAAAFDRTRKTVLALQGLAPKPADRAVGTFTQRDFDRLTRGVLRGYRARLSDLSISLGKAYLHQVPECQMAFLGRGSDAGEESVFPALSRTRESFLSVGGSWENLESPDRFSSVSDPFSKSVASFSLAISLQPHSSIGRYWEGMAYAKNGHFDKAEQSFALGLDLAKEGAGRLEILRGFGAVAFLRQDHLRQIHFLELVLQDCPGSAIDLNNLAMAKLNLGALDEGVSELEDLYASATESPVARLICLRALTVAPHWNFFQGNPVSYRRLLTAARIYLGLDAAVMIERVGL